MRAVCIVLSLALGLPVALSLASPADERGKAEPKDKSKGAEHTVEMYGIEMKVTVPEKGVVGDEIDCHIVLINKSKKAVWLRDAPDTERFSIKVTGADSKPVPLTKYGKLLAAAEKQPPMKSQIKLLLPGHLLRYSVNLSRRFDITGEVGIGQRAVTVSVRKGIRFSADPGRPDDFLLESKDFTLKVEVE
jgi:hypothetical protein